MFQCSSASRKFLNVVYRSVCVLIFDVFQCSSASRKFLNRGTSSAPPAPPPRVSVLFSEPKIPQYRRSASSASSFQRFSALQRAENSSISGGRRTIRIVRRVSVLFSEPKIPQCVGWSRRCSTRRRFQCSSASRKFLNKVGAQARAADAPVSVLFSEPKIPQYCSRLSGTAQVRLCFSALQRAENSSMEARRWLGRVMLDGFSALQRAENSSITNCTSNVRFAPTRFQCSSASRKFLNMPLRRQMNRRHSEFQCSSASRKFLNTAKPIHYPAQLRTFQCSSASRKFLNGDGRERIARHGRVSVLFSEPKIPQFGASGPERRNRPTFQCSSASRKFLNSSQ